MSSLLRSGQEVVGELSGLRCKVERFLGGGGQVAATIKIHSAVNS